MMRRQGQRAALLLGALAIALCYAQEPVAVRLRDAVGDTIDLAERDSFRLFPNTAGFRRAVVLALPGPEFFAEVTLAGTDTTTQVYLRIMPTELERIRFLVDNREYMAGQVRSDSSAALALAAFWREIESRPLRSVNGEPAEVHGAARESTEAATAGEPAEVRDTTRGPADTATAGGPQPHPATIENRYNYTLHGVTCGSGAGGCIGTQIAFKQVGSTGGCISEPIYTVNHPLFWSVACGLTALGSVAGYAVGDKLDRRAVTRAPPLNGGTGWRTGCAIGAAIPGLALGAGFAVLTIASRGTIENDPSNLTALPLALAGVCIAVEVTTIGYRIGRSIDRGNAR